MPRRIYTYPTGRGWDVWNFVATLGSFLIALSVLVFMYNLWVSRKGPHVGDDPWDARTLEWTIPSPPPEYNFKEVPVVTARDDFWHRSTPRTRTGGPSCGNGRCPVDVQGVAPDRGHRRRWSDSTDVAVTDDGDGSTSTTATTTSHGDGEHEEHVHIHLPSPSYWPLFTAVGLAVICYGMIYKWWIVAALGGVWLLGGIYAWGLEPATEPEPPEEHNGDHAVLEPDGDPSDTAPSDDLEPVGQA